MSGKPLVLTNLVLNRLVPLFFGCAVLLTLKGIDSEFLNNLVKIFYFDMLILHHVKVRGIKASIARSATH